MPVMRWRASWFFILLAAFALCAGVHFGPRVSAKDTNDDSAAVGDTGSAADSNGVRDEKPAKDKAKTNSSRKEARPKASKKKRGGRGAEESNDGTTASGPGSSGGVPSNIPGTSGVGSNPGPADSKSGVGSPTAPAVRGSGSSSSPAGKKVGGTRIGGGAGAAAPAGQPGPNPELVKKVIAIQDRATPDLIKQKGIVGTATGLDDDGNVVIRVYTTGADDPKVPATIENIPVVEIQSGPWNFRWAPPPFDPKLRQPRPVPIGVSAVSENGACMPIIAAGTLGCRLRSKNGDVFALSNNHVFAAENAGVIGDKIIQPGSLDEFNNGQTVCDSADVVGTLFKFKPYVVNGANLMDAAIMKTDVSQVGNSSPAPPIAYGTPRTTVFNRPWLGLKVQKFGRTTGHTTGTVTALNQTALIGGTALGPLLFVKQIEVTGDNVLPFSIQGDSGSLIVDMDRFPVALLFAGAGIFTNGNPIQTVLDEFDMSIDGDDSPVVPPGKEGRSLPERP